MAKAANDRALTRALALLETNPLIDGHNDLPWMIRNDTAASGDVAAYDVSRRRNDGDTDIPRLREGRGRCATTCVMCRMMCCSWCGSAAGW